MNAAMQLGPAARSNSWKFWVSPARAGEHVHDEWIELTSRLHKGGNSKAGHFLALLV